MGVNQRIGFGVNTGSENTAVRNLESLSFYGPFAAHRYYQVQLVCQSVGLYSMFGKRR